MAGSTRYSISTTIGPLRGVSERRTSGSARTSRDSSFGPLTVGIRIHKPSTGDTNKVAPEMSSAPSTPMAFAVLPHAQLPSAIPPRYGRLIGRQRTTGDPARSGELNADIEHRDRSRPGGACEDERASGQNWRAADRDNSDTDAHDDHAQSDRNFVSQTPPKRGDIERSYHRAHAKRPQHDAVCLRAAMQEVARDNRHERRDRSAGNSGNQGPPEDNSN